MATDTYIVENYLSRLTKTIEELPREAVQKTIDILRDARKNKK